MKKPLITTCLLVLMQFAYTVLAEEKGQARTESERAFEALNEMAKRTNGVLLKTTAELAKDKEGDKIKVSWTLDYDGPRPPLIILTPYEGASQTCVFIYADGQDGSRYEFLMRAAPIAGVFAPGKEAFSTMEKGKALKGEYVIPLAKIRTFYQKNWPKQFGEKPPKLFLRMNHQTSERGTQHKLDAWTGDLNSKVMEVSPAEW
jgi:hypothetical protein